MTPAASPRAPHREAVRMSAVGAKEQNRQLKSSTFKLDERALYV